MYIGTFLGKLFSFRKVKIFFRGFLNLSCKCVDSQKKFFATVVKIALSVAKESFLIKKINFFKKFYLQHFWSSGKFFVFLSTKLRQACQKFIVHVQTNILRRNRFFGKFFFQHFRSSSKKFSEFWQECFGRVVTTAFYMYIGTFWGIFFIISKNSWFFRRFRNLRCKSVDFYRKNFASFIKIAFYVAKESCLVKKNLLKKL